MKLMKVVVKFAVVVKVTDSVTEVVGLRLLENCNVAEISTALFREIVQIF